MAVDTQEIESIVTRVLTDALKNRPTTDEMRTLIGEMLRNYATKDEVMMAEKRIEQQVGERYEQFRKLNVSVDEHLRLNEKTMRDIEKLMAEFKPIPETVHDMQELMQRFSEAMVNQQRDLREVRDDLYGSERRPDVPSVLQLIRDAEVRRAAILTEVQVVKTDVERWKRYETFLTQRLWPILSNRRAQISAAAFSVFITGRISAPGAMDKIGEILLAAVGQILSFIATGHV